MEVKDYIQGLKAGDKRVLSKAITLAESTLPEKYELALEIVEHFEPSHTSRRIGITGTPGSGKSTFIDSYGSYLLHKYPDQRIAVLSVDPSSSISGGSILGDKTRMGELSKYEQVYIRPTASGHQHGGLARSTRLALLLCEAAGYNTLFIESVGVGQGETELAHLADLFVLLLNPGGGDELQGIKRGIVEMADLLIVNKADAENRKIAAQTALDYRNAQHLMPQTHSGWHPKVVECSALEKLGLEEVESAIQAYFDYMDEEHKLQKRKDQANYWTLRMLQDAIADRLRNSDLEIDKALAADRLPERIALELSKRFFD